MTLQIQQGTAVVDLNLEQLVRLQGDLGIVPIEPAPEPKPDLALKRLDEGDSTHFYFGLTSQDGAWEVRRQNRLTSVLEAALPEDNSSLDQAWEQRTALSYRVISAKQGI